jgi:hypothetical protein
VIRLLIIILAYSFLSCTKAHVEEEFQILRVEDLPQDFRVSSKIWDVTKSTDPAIKDKPIFYGPMQIKFWQKKPGLLKDGNVIFEFASGGGGIDLSQVVNGQQGTFYVSFDMPGIEKVVKHRAYHISRSRQRKVDGEVIGTGCKKLLDLSSGIGKLNFKNEIKLNTTRDRHVSLLAGNFVFLTETDSNWIVSQVTFYDTKRQDLICPEVSPSVSEQ